MVQTEKLSYMYQQGLYIHTETSPEKQWCEELCLVVNISEV